MTGQPTTRHAIITALSKLDTSSSLDEFTIPLEQAGALADLLEPEFRRRMALAWHVGRAQGVKWAQVKWTQGEADEPLRNPYEDEEDTE